MAEKLSESIWSSFTKKNKLELEDGALLKALARFDKTDEAKPEPRRDALKDVAEQIKKQVAALVKQKKALGDKPFNDAKDKLYGLLESAEALQEEIQAAQASDDDDADSPALLTTAMVPLVKQLQKGEVQMHALIASDGKKAAVLIMRRPISPSRRKFLAEYLQQSSGIKYFKAECAGGKGQLEFLLDSSPAGLSKKLRAAILAQTGLRTKVLVHFGDETETDGEDLEEGGGDGVLPTTKTVTTAATTAAATKATEPDPGIAFKTRLIELLPLIKGAAAANQLAAPDIKLKASEAGMLASKKDFSRANAVLDEVDVLLRQGQMSPSEAQKPPETKPTGSVISPAVAFTQARLAWDQTRKKIQSDLRKLEAAILAQCEAEPDAADIAAGTKNLYSLLESLDERLIDKLDEALNAPDAAQRLALHTQARNVVDEYLAFVARDPLMQDIDNNGFASTSILSSVSASLKLISTRLAAAQSG